MGGDFKLEQMDGFVVRLITVKVILITFDNCAVSMGCSVIHNAQTLGSLLEVYLTFCEHGW